MNKVNVMIRRNLAQPDVKATRYPAHGGGIAHMILDSRHLQTMMFLGHAHVPPGETLIGHVDPMEEIYYIERGKGRMQVGNEVCEVETGDAISIPVGYFHELINTGNEDLSVLVIAGLIPG
jgi:mannose-6-phosphate isomerase-like protein (cupin superfamily)